MSRSKWYVFLHSCDQSALELNPLYSVFPFSALFVDNISFIVHSSDVDSSQMTKQEYQMDYAFWFMMMVVACIVYSVLQYTLKAAVRRFTRRGSVENEDHSYIIEGILVKTMFQFLACEVESLNVS